MEETRERGALYHKEKQVAVPYVSRVITQSRAPSQGASWKASRPVALEKDRFF